MNELELQIKKTSLLSNGKTNAKTSKELAGFEFNNYIHYMSPASLSGVNLCPSSSAGCRKACLYTAGLAGVYKSVNESRSRKASLFIKSGKAYIAKLDQEIKKPSKTGATKAVRLNGTTDISWERIKLANGLNLFEANPNVIFYDYTAVLSRVVKLAAQPIANYSLTFSRKEDNWSDCLEALKLGVNVAAVFDDIPSSYEGFEVINGDEHDFRFLDPKRPTGVIVGLKAKGKARNDESGFVIRLKNIKTNERAA